MKQFFTTLLLLSICTIASAQIQYLPTENRSRNQSTSTQQSDPYNGLGSGVRYNPSGYQEPAPQIVRTTAYFSSGDNLYKVPIKVKVQGTHSSVSEEYTDNGMGGQWRRVTSGNVQKCSSMSSYNPLEGQFMYKANVGGRWYYFDL